jgi:hypothetical protein
MRDLFLHYTIVYYLVELVIGGLPLSERGGIGPEFTEILNHRSVDVRSTQEISLACPIRVPPTFALRDEDDLYGDSVRSAAN